MLISRGLSVSSVFGRKGVRDMLELDFRRSGNNQTLGMFVSTSRITHRGTTRRPPCCCIQSSVSCSLIFGPLS